MKHTNFQLEVTLGILLQQKKHITTLESELKEHGRVIGELVYKWQLAVYMVAQSSPLKSVHSIILYSFFKCIEAITQQRHQPVQQTHKVGNINLSSLVSH